MTNNLTQIDDLVLPIDQTDSRTPFEYAAFICSLFMLACCIVGVFGNAMSVLIFTRPSMKSSINVLLTGLSLIDLLMLATSIPVFVIPNLNSYFKQTLVNDSYYLMIVFGPYQFGMIAQTSSVWTFVLISTERYLAVCKPLKVSRLLTVTRARMALLGVVCSAILYNIVRFFEYQRIDPSEYSDDDHTPKVYFKPWLRQERFYFVFYHIGLYLLTHFLGPFIIITVLNVFILNAMRKSKRVRARLVPNIIDVNSNNNNNNSKTNLLRQSFNFKRDKSLKRSKMKRSTTQMIIIVTAIFLICNVLPLSLNLLESAMPHVFNNEDLYLQAVAYLVVDLSNTLVVFNSATTFLFYIIYCKKYRQLFKYYCLHFLGLRSNNDSSKNNRFYDSSTLDGTERSNIFDMQKFLENIRRKKTSSTADLPFVVANEYSSNDENGSSPKFSIPRGDKRRCIRSAMIDTSSNDSMTTKL